MNIFDTLCYVEIETISACTRKCPWCLFGVYPNARPQIPQYLEEDRIFSIFYDLKYSGFKGGIGLFSINEPLLDERITSGRLICECKKIFNNKVLVTLTTNGDLLTDDIANKMLDAGLDILKISCYSKQTFYAMKKHFDNNERIIIHDQTRYLRNEYESNRAGTIQGSVRMMQSYKSCYYPLYRVAIAWDGEIRICYNDILQKVKIGNIYNNKLSSILNSNIMEETRNSILYSREKYYPCCECNVSGEESKLVSSRDMFLSILGEKNHAEYE